MQGDRLIKIAVRVQYEKGLEGNLFKGLPPNLSFEGIVALAQNREGWKDL